MNFKILIACFLILNLSLYSFSFVLNENKNEDEKKPYDHQTETYYGRFAPTSNLESSITVTPFFSPDKSLKTHVDLIERAEETVDVLIPSFGQFNYCVPFSWKCSGCYISFWRYHSQFPIFQALINAIHRGIKVRVLTNNYENKMCRYNSVTNLDYLLAAGAEVKYFKTVAFMHAKHLLVDKKIALISSINYSKSSLMKNREAGVLVSNDESGRIIKFVSDVFEHDFNKGKILKNYNFTLSDWEKKMVDDKTSIPITFPKPYTFKCKTESPSFESITSEMDFRIFASPDYGYDELINGLKSASKSIYVSIYQITQQEITDFLINLKKNKPYVELKIFVSDKIYGDYDREQADIMYKQLMANGIKIRKSAEKCLNYSHQKYWIIDDKIVYMSTGNWSPSDYPIPPYTFPPYGHQNWRKVNRDFTVSMKNQRIVEKFKQVYELDYEQGHDIV